MRHKDKVRKDSTSRKREYVLVDSFPGSVSAFLLFFFDFAILPQLASCESSDVARSPGHVQRREVWSDGLQRRQGESRGRGMKSMPSEVEVSQFCAGTVTDYDCASLVLRYSATAAKRRPLASRIGLGTSR